MKLKNLLLIGTLLLPLLACDEDIPNYFTETMIKLYIPTNSHLVDNDGVSANYQFNGIRIFCLEYSNHLEDCPGNIARILPGNGSFLSFNNLDSNDTITELQLKMSYKTQAEHSFTTIQITELLEGERYLSNETHMIVLDDFLTPLIDQLNNNPRYLISIEIKGFSSFNLSSDVELIIPIKIETEYNSPRLTL